LYKLVRNIYIFAAITVIVFISSWYWQYQQTNRRVEDSAMRLAEISVCSLNRDVSMHLTEQAAVVNAAATFIASERWGEEDILAYLTALLADNESFASIYYGTPDNQMVNASGWQPPDGFNLLERPWYQKARSEKGSIFTEAFLNASGDQVVFTIACPVYNGNNRLLGVVGGDVDINSVTALINKQNPESGVFSFLVDSNGNMMAHPEISYQPGSPLISVEEYYGDQTTPLTGGSFGEVSFYPTTVEGYIAYHPLEGTDWQLGAYIPLDNISGISGNISGYLLAASATSLLVFLLFVFYHNRWIHKPLLEFENNLLRVNIEKSLSYRLPETGHNEFTPLAETINNLLEQIQTSLQEAEENEQSLIKANHELEKILEELTNAEEALDYSEEKLYYLSYHDQLTGLYNRAFFEAKLVQLSTKPEYPVSIISADIDGLKLINDTIGQSAGNKLVRHCALIISEALDGTGILARVGGDEFSAILPLTGQTESEHIIRQIRYQIALYNEENSNLPLSLSLGAATAEDKSTSLKKLFKQADDFMFRNKLYHGAIARNGIVQSLLTALAERDYFTEGHARRLEQLCLKVGEKMGLASHQLTDLALLAQVHDLGKVGIPDSILHKAGPLTEEEWEIMKQHPEKGYRIASSAPDLSSIANLILRHHEHWNGGGYPLGLKERDIPIECRILAVADAYDAMTNERPFKKPVSSEEALAELEQCAGSQFDPEVVEIFLKEVKILDSGTRINPLFSNY